MRFAALLFLFFLIGCTLSRSMEVRGSACNVESVYGSGNANAEYKSSTNMRFLNGR